ncbi:hypothetical protein CCACVL1_22912 [Corchorus capsularis]|uniref:Uncharacterized protein n=1 Tax=Corchorus capsularis TaxID=210143 RepID=A0A1R3GW05_COCAP|nr:hypothetical protein CCACVL1_22912 [Corchorus capsularis]
MEQHGLKRARSPTTRITRTRPSEPEAPPPEHSYPPPFFSPTRSTSTRTWQSTHTRPRFSLLGLLWPGSSPRIG